MRMRNWSHTSARSLAGREFNARLLCDPSATGATSPQNPIGGGNRVSVDWRTYAVCPGAPRPPGGPDGPSIPSPSPPILSRFRVLV